MKEVWIVGATSHVAKALIHQNSLTPRWKLKLFARTPELVLKFLAENCAASAFDVLSLDTLEEVAATADTIINCVGFGSPARQRVAGADLFSVSEKTDERIIDILKRNDHTKYVNLSSGAVYGDLATKPASDGHVAAIDVSPIKTSDFYRITKLHQEAKHRSLVQFSITDIRLFSFFSQFVALDSGYLLADIVASLRSGIPLVTDLGDVYRDYISPWDFFQLVDLVVESPFLNTAFDTYSIDPISKSRLLASLRQEYGLVVQTKPQLLTPPTGEKSHYYSRSRKAQEILGYSPTSDSWESIKTELLKLGISPKDSKRRSAVAR